MREKEHHIGPGAVSLLLIIVVVSMSVLGLLSMISARGDYKLTERAIDLAVSGQAASAEAEKTLSELDAILVSCAEKTQDDEEYLALIAASIPEEMTMRGRNISWKEQVSGGRTLNCTIEVLDLGKTDRILRVEHIFSAEGNTDE